MSGSCVTITTVSPRVAIEPDEQVHDLDAARRVEIAGRLVGEQHRWLCDNGPGDRHALHLSARELRRCVRFPAGEPDRGERFARTLVPLACADAAIDERELHVLERGCAVEQIESLKDESE